LKIKFLLGILFISSNLFAQTDQEINDKIVSLINAEKYKEALPLTEKFLEKNPEDFAAHYNHAVNCFHLKKNPEAINDYKFLEKEKNTNTEYQFQI
jgi:tetratricopeptide (TPR) repeat protein